MSNGKKTSVIYTVIIACAFLSVTWMVIKKQRALHPAPLGNDRAALRSQKLAELHKEEAETLGSTAWIDKGKGIVRLPIDVAMKVTLGEWQNPAAARSNLVVRVEKANTVPPKAPAKPSEFE